MIFALLLLFFAVTIPPAAKVLAVVGAVYVILQGLKKVPGLSNILSGWVAVAVNIIFSACGLLVTIPADQLYTANTLITLITVSLSAAGIHGTVSTMSKSGGSPAPGAK